MDRLVKPPKVTNRKYHLFIPWKSAIRQGYLACPAALKITTETARSFPVGPRIRRASENHTQTQKAGACPSCGSDRHRPWASRMGFRQIRGSRPDELGHGEIKLELARAIRSGPEFVLPGANDVKPRAAGSRRIGILVAGRSDRLQPGPFSGREVRRSAAVHLVGVVPGEVRPLQEHPRSLGGRTHMRFLWTFKPACTENRRMLRTAMVCGPPGYHGIA